MRPNVPWPSRTSAARFVGGAPSRYFTGVDLERVYEGEVVSEPIFSDGAAWVRVHVHGIFDDILVPVENLRP